MFQGLGRSAGIPHGLVWLRAGRKRSCPGPWYRARGVSEERPAGTGRLEACKPSFPDCPRPGRPGLRLPATERTCCVAPAPPQDAGEEESEEQAGGEGEGEGEGAAGGGEAGGDGDVRAPRAAFSSLPRPRCAAPAGLLLAPCGCGAWRPCVGSAGVHARCCRRVAPRPWLGPSPLPAGLPPGLGCRTTTRTGPATSLLTRARRRMRRRRRCAGLEGLGPVFEPRARTGRGGRGGGGARQVGRAPLAGTRLVLPKCSGESGSGQG